MAEFSIGKRVFKSKDSATRRVSLLLNETLHDSELYGDDYELMCDLLHMHPQAAVKIGTGISGIVVRKNPWGGKTFYVRRNDGTETDFSFHSCFQGERAHRLSFRNACRFAVLPYVREVRALFFACATTPTCALTGVELTIENAHIDHAPPYTFDRIYRAFLVLNDIDENDPTLCRHVDNELEPHFANTALRDRWIAFHHSLAQLRCISKTANEQLVREFVSRNGNGHG